MDLMQQALSIFLVLTMLGAALWWLRRRGLVQMAAGIRRPGAQPRMLEMVERLPIVPNSSVLVIRAVNRALVVLVQPTGCAVLENLSWDQVQRDRADGRRSEGQTA